MGAAGQTDRRAMTELGRRFRSAFARLGMGSRARQTTTRQFACLGLASRREPEEESEPEGSRRLAEAPGSRTQPSRDQREATDFEDREGHRAPFASVGVLPARGAAAGIIS
jgi:hypothetical protein